MSECKTKELDDDFGSVFDDLDIDSIPLFQTDFANDVDLDYLFTGCETQSSNNDVKDGSFTRKNSTLASLLKPHPSCGYVPPAPQIHMESNSVIEPGICNCRRVNFQEYETYPQLKSALIQEKALDTSPGSAGLDNADGSWCTSGHPGHLFQDISSITVNPLNMQSHQHTRLKSQADGWNLPQQSDDVRSIRRSPHNAIERRYRQSINGKINELREILNASSGDDTKTNKSAVLRRAIDRIRYLEKENECLRMQLSMYENGYAVVNDIDEEGHFGFKSSKGRLVRLKVDSAVIPQQVEVLRPIQKPRRQSPMPRPRTLQQPLSSWGSQGGHLPPIGSSDEGSPPSMIGVSSIVSSTSDDVSTISSPESYQFIHVNRKRNADTHLFQQVCPSDAKMGAFYAPGDRFANDDPIRLPLHPFTMASDGFGEPSPMYNPADVAYTGVNGTGVNGSNECQAQVSSSNGSESNFTRLSLFWGSFSLLMFNPFVIPSSGGVNREGAHSTGMPILRLLSAISLSFRHSEGSSDTGLMLSPLLLSFMYAAQWVVAILLLLFACPRNFGSILPSFLTRGRGKRIRGVINELPGGQVSLIHWKKSQEHAKKRAWIEAGSHLKESLAVLGASPCFDNGLVSAFRARASAYVEGLRFVMYRLPQFFWPFLRKCPIPRASQSPQSDAPTVSQLRRQLLDLKFLDLIHLSDDKPVPHECSVVSEMSSCECLHVVHLMLACLDDFVIGWRSAHRGKLVDMAELTRLGLVLALSVKRFFGVNWLGNLLLRATQSVAELNDGFVCLGPKDGPIMAMLLALSSNDFCRKYKTEGKGAYYHSFLKIQIPESNVSPSKSLVVDEVYHDICERFITKALECIVSSNLEPASPFESYLKEIKRLTWLLYGEKSSFLRSSASDESSESSFSLTDGESGSREAWEEKAKELDEANIWWLSILKLAGRWYAGSLDFESVAPNERFTPSLSKMGADAQLISLAYNLLHVTQSKAFNAPKTNPEGVETMLFEVWAAIREVFDLLEQTPLGGWGGLSFPLENGFKQTVDLKNYVLGVYQLVAQDWILHSLNSIADKLQQESSHGKDVVSSTSGCRQPSMTYNSITRLFSDILERQRQLVRCLQAPPSLWLTRVEVMYRQLNRANPVWASLIWDQKAHLPHRCRALPDKALDMNSKRPTDGWRMSAQKNRLTHTKYIGQ